VNERILKCIREAVIGGLLVILGGGVMYASVRVCGYFITQLWYITLPALAFCGFVGFIHYEVYGKDKGKP
jgi:hypothetical protein